MSDFKHVGFLQVGNWCIDFDRVVYFKKCPDYIRFVMEDDSVIEVEDDTVYEGITQTLRELYSD